MLLWIDLETTGLNVDQDIPLEIGVILTTESGLIEVARRNWLCKIKYYEWMPTDPFIVKMHTENGLLQELENEDTRVYQSWAELDDEITDWLLTYTFEVLHPAGSSVHFDVDFIRKRFLRFASTLHHRHLDVSSVKLLYPAVGLAYDPGPEDEHRALSDLDNDIKWLKWFLYHSAAFFPRVEDKITSATMEEPLDTP